MWVCTGREGSPNEQPSRGTQTAQLHFRPRYEHRRAEIRRVSAPHPQDTSCKARHSALLTQKYSLQHASLSYPLPTPKQQGTGDYSNEQHEQEIQRCGARFKAQMIQAVLCFTGGHSLGVYTSFIKLQLNWCSHPDSRNHHASFPFKRGNKPLIFKAVSARGSQSLPRPCTQPAACPQAAFLPSTAHSQHPALHLAKPITP